MMLFVLSLLVLAHGCEEEWDAFTSTYGRSYLGAEKVRRRQVFCANLEQIKDINSQDLSWTAGVNQFTDLTWEEFQAEVGLMDPQNCSATVGTHKAVEADPPKAKDWRNETCGETSCVSMVKNQGSCGSCWTFSTVGALEAAHAIVTGMMILLSEQQLVDCAQGFNNNGCNGGLPSQAFEYVKYNGGLDTMASYPYVCGDGHCKPTSGPCGFKNETVGVQVTDVFNFTAGDEKSMQDVVGLQQPISVAFEVVDDLQHYSSGVYSSKKCKKGADTVNHAVLAVGYGSHGKKHKAKKFWTIKNSWGAGWGNQGYFNMERDVNMCGVATCSSYPKVANITERA